VEADGEGPESEEKHHSLTLEVLDVSAARFYVIASDRIELAMRGDRKL